MTLLDSAITIPEMIAKCEERGLKVSERTLRKRAKETGACRVLGNTIFFLPEHLDKIFAEPTCPNQSRDRGRRTTSSASRSATDELNAVRAKLAKPKPEPKRPQSSLKQSPNTTNVVSLPGR